MYQPPHITSYAEAELIDLMGPVETQYGPPPPPPPPPCCDILSASVDPPFFLQGKDDVEVCLDIGACEDFRSVTFTLFDSSNRQLTSGSFSASNGSQSGAMWCIDYEFGFVPDPGEYRIEIIATDGNNCSSDPISVSIEVLGN